MSGYQGLKLALPQIGSTGNWGAAINRNFNLINSEINNIHQRLQSFQSILGAQIPYIKVDNNKFFVVIQQITNVENELYRLVYYKKPETTIEEEDLDEYSDHKYKRQSDGSFAWEPSIDNFLAAYVIKTCKVEKENDTTYEEISGEEAELSQADVFGGVQYKRGDLMVRAQSFGSIYGDYATTTFKKYPPMGEYYEPVWTIGQPYKLIFQKQNYVDNFFNSYEHTFTLPTIGMGTFNIYEYENNSGSFYLTINGDQDNKQLVMIDEEAITLEFSVSKTSGQHLEPHIQWYIKNQTGSYQPVFIGYEVSSEEDDSSVEYTINFDISNVASGEIVKATIYFTHSGEVQQQGYTPAE